MKLICMLIIVIALDALPAMAQRNGTITGIAFDTVSKKPVSDVTVTLLLKKDSSLISFETTDNSGRFTFRNLAEADYRILFSHISFHNSVTYITISAANKNINLDKVIMNDRTRLLEEVVVQNEAPPVTLIGDTVQYNANSFKTQPNATVEQLLKKLPGVQVQKDGTVKAQGQNVAKVLVDGKEFFGNDPKMATKNLPADAIDKVQVYDKLSDQAALTGFDDGNSEKTINLKLKKDKKKGSFGKIMGGGGTDERFEGRANINSFKGARQMSAIATANNTNTEGFSFLDMMNFTGELGRMMRGGNGNVTITMSDADGGAIGPTNSGIRTIWGAGLNYNNIIGKKTELTSNYFYNHFNPKKVSDLQTQYFLPDSSYFYNQHALDNTVTNSQRLNLGFDFVIDSFHSLKISPSLGLQETENSTMTDYVQTGNDGTIGNRGYNHSNSKGTAQTFRNDILYRQKSRKRGRTFSFSLQTTLNSSTTNGFLESINESFTRANIGGLPDTINQQITGNNDLRGYSARAVYTEPVLKRSLLELSIGRSNNRNSSTKITNDYNPGTKQYSNLNDSLTNDYLNDYSFTNAGIRLRTQKKKYNYAVGFSLQRADLEGKLKGNSKDSVVGKSFTNLLPTARFQYNFTRYKNLMINYSTNTNQPNLSQLQPVPDISDRLNIKEGNPDLKQEFSQTVQVNYSGVSPYKQKNFFAFLNLTRTDNKIVNDDKLSTSGVRTTKPVNVNGVYNLSGDISYGLPVRFIKGSLRLGTRTSYNKGRQFVNDQPNDIKAYSMGPAVGLDMSPSTKLDISLSAAINYNKTWYSLSPLFNTNYLSQIYETGIDWDLPKGLHVATDFTYTINNQRAAGYNTNIPLWGFSMSKQVLKFNRGEIKLRVNDILNQNVGVSRTSDQNSIQDSRVNTLKRYALLSFTYSLSKRPATSGRRIGFGG